MKINQFLKRICRQLKEICIWILEIRIIFVGIIPIVTAILLSFFWSRGELDIRFAGYVLQFGGMMLAMNSLLALRMYFNQKTLRELFIDWLKRFPKWKKTYILKPKPFKMPIVGLYARMSEWAEDDPAQTVEERIGQIVKNLKNLRQGQNQQYDCIEKLISENKTLKKDTIKKNEQLEQKIMTTLESLHTDDILIALFGLIWILIGSAMSTLSPELFMFIK